MKNTNAQVMAKVLTKIAQAVRRLDESEIEKLLAGDFRVELVLGAREKRHNKNAVNPDADAEKDISDVARRLRSLDDRDEGRFILEQRVPNKDLLTRLVRYLDLPLHKQETTERLKDKIIEATIGYRLRSRAIRGTGDLGNTAN
uniref:Uncharacterized protein n=1 Tax=Candidatus Kentrum sp. LFY TaxID=2126342 RepID=A0A450UFI9_9GAMM|nr:MAG: hypothetical protein BECKLFY1418B_GA0070995_102518 [Candidatus Kentron sp. LFY]VFJ93291.1 MAG: hypothetical protein BECKLFY1418A_GA0070994_103030 [Candidatus Kentron sp. LFY]